MTDAKPYRTLFVGTLVQDSFLSVGGTDDPYTTVDSPFCRDGLGRPTIRGTGLAGALIATLRRHLAGQPLPELVPDIISGGVATAGSTAQAGGTQVRIPSVWRFFNSHPEEPAPAPAHRQHVAIDARTGAAATGALFNVETLPPKTCWPFMLEVDTSRKLDGVDAVGFARLALTHWMHGRCLLGREVARGMGWMWLEDLHEFTLTTDHLDAWPNAQMSNDYHAYIQKQFAQCGTSLPPPETAVPMPGWVEIEGTLSAGKRDDDYGIDSLSIGGHASEELAAAWDARFLAPDGMTDAAAKNAFDPDFSVVTWDNGIQRVPFIPGSSLRGPLRHTLSRLLKGANLQDDLVKTLFGTTGCSAKLLIRDALSVADDAIKLAWFQLHAEDEFAGSTYGTAKFDRVAVMQGCFQWKMVLEDATDEEQMALGKVFKLVKAGQIGIGGGQWRGHGWLRWESDDFNKLKSAAPKEQVHG